MAKSSVSFSEASFNEYPFQVLQKDLDDWFYFLEKI